MIIGINGKIGSGKDTVGRIIQYLTCGADRANIPYEIWDGKTVWNVKEHPWQVKKFAYKLKQIVALLTGCTVEDLESQDFKKKLLGPEWDQSTQYNGKECHNCGSINNTYVMSDNPTYRELLQVVGTEAMRNVIHENVWVNALMSDYTETIWDPSINTFVIPDWIITDMRFPNELEAVEKRGGITIRVNRDIHNGNAHIAPIPHASETALDNHKFDYVINNDGSLSDLVNKVKEILIKEKII